jgi:putative phosphoribosyl transferase
MIFKNRADAGQQLAKALKVYANKDNTLVIALPRGGVVVGYEVARLLHLPLDIVCPRKIGAPVNPELAIGSVTETGEKILFQDLIKTLSVSEAYIQEALEREKEKALWRLHYYRQHKPARQLKGKTVILVDDGLATGATMQAAIRTCKTEKAATLVLAVPVSPPDTLTDLKHEVDTAICLSAPPSFYAVGQFYLSFDPTSDEEVISLLSKLDTGTGTGEKLKINI